MRHAQIPFARSERGVVMPNVFGVLLRKHGVGIAHCNAKVAFGGPHLRDGVGPAVCMNVEEYTANTGGIRNHAPRDGSRKMNLVATDDVNYSRGIHVRAIVVAMIQNITELVLKCD